MVELVESVGLSECGKPNNSIVSYCAPNWETKVEAFIYSLSGVTLFRIGGKKQMNQQQESRVNIELYALHDSIKMSLIT